MANNRMYLSIADKKVTLAKGWGAEKWVVFEPETLAERINNMFKMETPGEMYASNCCVDYNISYEIEASD